MATLEELEARIVTLEASALGLAAQLSPLPGIKDSVDGLVANQALLVAGSQAITDRIDQQVVPIAEDALGRAQFALDKAAALEARADTLEAASADHEMRITVLENPNP